MVTKALNRIFWRFGGNGNKNPFPVNQGDLDALQELSDYVEETQKQQYEQNELFAKLYIYLSQKIMETDKSTVFETNHRRKIGNLLKKPLSQIVNDLTDSLNDSEQYALLQDAGCDFKHPALRIEGETTKQTQKLNELLRTPKNALKLSRQVWNYEQVNEAIIAEVNHIINLSK